MKTIKILTVAFFMLVVSMISVTSVFAQEASGDWTNNENIWETTTTGWSDTLPNVGEGVVNNAVSTVGGPVIIVQPKDVTYTIPHSATMSITVETPEAVNFQWQWKMNTEEGEPEIWRDYIGEGAQKTTLETKITNGLLDGRIVRCVVISKSDPAKITVSNAATYNLEGGSPEYYATIGNQIVEMGQTVNITEGGKASLSADGKTLTLDNIKLTTTSDYNYDLSGIGIQYAAISNEAAKDLKIQLIGENTVYADTEHSYMDSDSVKKSFAGLYFHALGGDTDNRLTLSIGGDGQLILDSSKQSPSVFDFYGIYAESYVKLVDTAKVTINNKYIGSICADLSMGENTALTIGAESNAMLLLPSYDAPGNFTMMPGSNFDATAKMSAVISQKGGGEFSAEGATIKLLGKMIPTDKTVDDEPVVIVGVMTARADDAVGTEGNMTLKNCDFETAISSNNEKILFQQGLRVAGDLMIDGGSFTVTSEILDESANSRGVMGIQANNVSMINNAAVDITVNGDNIAYGSIANEKMTIKDAGINVVIDNSAKKFSQTDTEAIGIGAQSMEIGMSGDQGRVNAQILGYDNGLPLVNYLESSNVRKDYSPDYQPVRLSLSDKAQFVYPSAAEAGINQASLEAHQVIGNPQNKYAIYEAVYNIKDTTKGIQQVTIAGKTEADLLSYKTHIQNIGWQAAVTDGEISGTTGKSLRLEAITINLNEPPYSGSIQYKSHIQNKGWENSFTNAGGISGSTNEGLRLEAIQIQLTGEMATNYDVYYQVYAQNFGWLSWAKNGDPAGTEGQSLRLEAIRMRIVPKGIFVSSDDSLQKAYVTLKDVQSN